MWKEINNKLERKFAFENFSSALDFVNKVGQIAEEMQHHPDILLHDYKFVTVKTSTHDKNAITDKDWQLSKKIDTISL